MSFVGYRVTAQACGESIQFERVPPGSSGCRTTADLKTLDGFVPEGAVGPHVPVSNDVLGETSEVAKVTNEKLAAPSAVTILEQANEVGTIAESIHNNRDDITAPSSQ